MRFAFEDPAQHGRKKPANHLADVEILFDEEGPLAGLKLVGLAIWSHGNGELSVTLPARRIEGSGRGKDWWYEVLRVQDAPDAQQRIQHFKGSVIAAYRMHAAQTGDRRAS